MENKKISINKILLNSPRIKQETYDKLPDMFNDLLVKFEDREKEVFLTSLLIFVSQVLVDVKFVYRGNTLYPTLFGLITAPAAQGKGVMNFIKDLSYHVSKRFKNNQLVVLDNENERRFSVKKVPLDEPSFMIPANSSSAAFIEKMYANQGEGFILDTEADSIVNVQKNEWGISSEDIRKAFSHETISKMRMSEKCNIEISNPRFSFAISGTPEQSLNFYKSSENGMFSRVLNLAFASNMEDDDSDNQENLNDFFRNKSMDFYLLKQFYQGREEQLKFILNAELKDRINRFFSNKSIDITLDEGDNAIATFRRTKVIARRILLLITLVRCFETNDRSNIIVYSENDVDATLELIEVYLEHSLILHRLLDRINSRRNKMLLKTNYREEILDDLDDQFETKDFYEACYKSGVFKSDKTIQRTITNFLEKGLIVRVSRGIYRKV